MFVIVNVIINVLMNDLKKRWFDNLKVDKVICV